MDTVHSPAPGAPNTAGRAAWICLAIAWACFLLPVPFLGLFVGWPLNLVAFILAIVAMSRLGALAGLFQLIASLVVSPIVYAVGLVIFAGSMQAASDRVQRLGHIAMPEAVVELHLAAAA